MSAQLISVDLYDPPHTSGGILMLTLSVSIISPHVQGHRADLMSCYGYVTMWPLAQVRVSNGDLSKG